MAEHKIITIGRQFGSGGHEIGNILATRLGMWLPRSSIPARSEILGIRRRSEKKAADKIKKIDRERR